MYSISVSTTRFDARNPFWLPSEHSVVRCMTIWHTENNTYHELSIKFGVRVEQVHTLLTHYCNDEAALGSVCQAEKVLSVVKTMWKVRSLHDNCRIRNNTWKCWAESVREYTKGTDEQATWRNTDICVDSYPDAIRDWQQLKCNTTSEDLCYSHKSSRHTVQRDNWFCHFVEWYWIWETRKSERIRSRYRGLSVARGIQLVFNIVLNAEDS